MSTVFLAAPPYSVPKELLQFLPTLRHFRPMAHDVAPDPLAGLKFAIHAYLAEQGELSEPEPDPRVRGLAVLASYYREHRLTQRKLAGLLNCAHSHAGRILRGESKVSFEHALAFERATGIRATEVLGLEPEGRIGTSEGSETGQVPVFGGFTA